MTTDWAPEFTQNDVVVLQEKEVFSGYCQIKQFQFRYRLFEGGMSYPVHRQIMSRPDAVAVLLYDPKEDKVVLIEQFRTGAIREAGGPWLLEIVAGVVEAGDDIEETVYREVVEEAGCAIQSLIPVCSYLVSPGSSSEKIFVYCGIVDAPTQGGIFGLSEEGENIKVHVMKTTDTFELLFQGKIVSSPTVIALQWLKINQGLFRVPQ